MELKNKFARVIGIGKSGISAARLLNYFGARVTLLEQKPRELVAALADDLEKLGVTVKAGGYGPKDFEKVDLVVLSPGVNEQEPVYQELMKKGIEVIGEMELAARFISAPILAVSGTDGKTTTVSLLGEIFRNQYRDQVWVGGNIGNPLSDLVLTGKKTEAVILEVSSFQLVQSRTFHPAIAVMLNLAPDHFDRHRGFQDYYQAKLRLFMNQNQNDAAVLNSEDARVAGMAGKIKSKLLWFGEEIDAREGARLLGKEIIYQNHTRKFTLSVLNWKPLGRHNLENLLAAAAAAGCFGIPPEAIQAGLDRFHTPGHRIEFITESRGVKYFDDSKGTTPHAVSAAIRSFSRPVILLLGGRNKGIDFSGLADQIKSKVKTVICFGESRCEIKEQLAGKSIRGVLAEKMEDAVMLARDLARPGEVVLLSPGCASFDEFKDYMERGDKFQELVRSFQ